MVRREITLLQLTLTKIVSVCLVVSKISLSKIFSGNLDEISSLFFALLCFDD